MICFVNQVFTRLNILKRFKNKSGVYEVKYIKAFQKCGAIIWFGGAKRVPLHHVLNTL